MALRRAAFWLMLVGTLVAGCERIPLTPPVLLSPTWQGAWDGVAVGTDDTWSSTMGVDTLSTGWSHWTQWTSQDGQVWEIRKHTPWSHPAVWEPGSWPWRVDDMSGVWEGEVHMWNADTWTLQEDFYGEDDEGDWEWVEGDSLQLWASHDDECEQTLQVELHPRQPCQEEWVRMPFEFTWESNGPRVEPPAVDVEMAWLWTLDGEIWDTTYTTGESDGHLHLPDSWSEGVVILEPLDPLGPLGSFWMRRTMNAGGWGGGQGQGSCEAISFELELEDRAQHWVEVRHLDREGRWWSSSTSCGLAPEGAWFFEATHVADAGLVDGWWAAEVSCAFTLPMAQEGAPEVWSTMSVDELSLVLPQ